MNTTHTLKLARPMPTLLSPHSRSHLHWIRPILGLVLTGFVFLPLPAVAAFVLVDNFEGFADEADVSGVNGWITGRNSTPNIFVSAGVGIVQQAADVSGAQSNVLTIVGANSYAYAYNSASTPDLADGTTGTLFFQIIHISDTIDFSIGLTDTALSAYHERAGVESHGGSFTALDGSSATFPTLSQNTLYNIWVVIHNETNVANDTYSLYVQGGTFIVQTQFATGERFRLGLDSSSGGVAGALDAFSMSQSRRRMLALDNIYVDTAGENLELVVVPELSSSLLLMGSLGILGITRRRRHHSLAFSSV